MRHKICVDKRALAAYYSARPLSGVLRVQVKDRMRLLPVLLMFLVLGMWATACPSELGGQFPGKGDYQTWLRANLLYNEGNHLAKAGDLTGAISKYKEAIRIYPFDYQYSYNLANTYVTRKEFKEAESEYRRAAGLNPSAWEVWNNLGYLLLQVGRAQEAKIVFSKALALDPPPQDKKDILMILSERTK